MKIANQFCVYTCEKSIVQELHTFVTMKLLLFVKVDTLSYIVHKYFELGFHSITYIDTGGYIDIPCQEWDFLRVKC